MIEAHSRDCGTQIRALLASYSTPIKSEPNLIHNISLAAALIDGTVLAPGDVFSFDDIVGPRTAERGFKVASVMIHGDLVPGEGGGVCQVASTLFNVALLADLRIVARTNHSRPITSAPIGRDATVLYGLIDLKFLNSTAHPLRLQARVCGEHLVMEAHGTPVDGKTVRAELEDYEEISPSSETITAIDPDLDAGQIVTREAEAGYRVNTYRIVEINGIEKARELVCASYYRTWPRRIRIGTKRAEATQPLSSA